MFIVLTGPKCAGKSTVLTRVAAYMKEKGLGVDGVISPRIWKNGVRYGYNVINVATGAVNLLAAESDALEGELIKFCSFSFSKSAFDSGNSGIIGGLQSDLLIVDEIGNMELGGEGWGSSMPRVAERKKPTLLSVRQDVVDKIHDKWGITPHAIVDVGVDGQDKAFDRIVGILDSAKL